MKKQILQLAMTFGVLTSSSVVFTAHADVVTNATKYECETFTPSDWGLSDDGGVISLVHNEKTIDVDWSNGSSRNYCALFYNGSPKYVGSDKAWVVIKTDKSVNLKGVSTEHFAQYEISTGNVTDLETRNGDKMDLVIGDYHYFILNLAYNFKLKGLTEDTNPFLNDGFCTALVHNSKGNNLSPKFGFTSNDMASFTIYDIEFCNLSEIGERFPELIALGSGYRFKITSPYGKFTTNGTRNVTTNAADVEYNSDELLTTKLFNFMTSFLGDGSTMNQILISKLPQNPDNFVLPTEYNPFEAVKNTYVKIPGSFRKADGKKFYWEGTNINDGNTLDFVFTDGYPFTSSVTFQTWKASYTRDFGNVGFGTMILPYKATIPEGVKAYTLSVANDEVVATEITETTIPTQTPVLVKATGVQTFTCPNEQIDIATPSVFSYDNLTGVYAEQSVAAGNYVMQMKDGELAFFQVAEGAEPTITPFRAYLTPGASLAPAMRVRFAPAGTTAIDAIGTDANVGEQVIYDLCGRRVNNMDKQGFYILNGKKVFVK